MDKKTPLYDEHVKAGARVVPFGGFLMPIQYTGIIDEHRAVRCNMGMFDLSHMGEFTVWGDGAREAVDALVANDVCSLEIGQVRYTPMCYPDGGIVDDLLVYRFPDHLLLVVNASNIDKDFEWMRQHLPPSVRLENESDGIALIAVQGPKSEGFLQRFTDMDLATIGYYHFKIGMFAEVEATLSRTGYTGEDGFELYVPGRDASRVWDALWSTGEPEGLRLVGLGARDTLRLEAGYMLYGNDIDETTSPLEAGLGWTVKFQDRDFIGRGVLERQKADGVRRRMVAIDMDDRAIPRPHYSVTANGGPVGDVTSGTFSPTFERGIALAYVDREYAKSGTLVAIEVRGQPHPARVVRKPMYKREGA